MALGFAWPFRQSAPVLRVPGVVEIQEVKLASKVGCRVKQVFVQEGDLVQAGDELASFEKFLAMLNDCDDVQEIYHNVALP